MKLADWRDAEGIEREDFARRIETTAESVRRYEVGERIPDRSTMPKIVRETGGRVTPNDFFDMAAAEVVS